ncbi:MAG: thiamine pyrophosphate-dependent enzyme [Candidatus Jordarchaeum sp.]|uniref:thiamine pyrophosphate-dependent enzyme n=1 Tax=Candidatus Jordarchaeum sp. TaxID=2823881 RepID=UPI00404997E9
MSGKSQHPLMKYIRPETLPLPYCPGCGDGVIAQCVLRAIDELSLDFTKMAFVSGIGCAGWIPSPLFNSDVIHTPHGRPIPFATGLKLAKPELNVVVISGDGDLSAIGGNHLIHGARRNIGLSVICVNNFIYGMTGAQVAPTTPHGLRTDTTPYGNPENPFDLCKLVEAAGGTYVVRWSTLHVKQLTRSIKKALQRKGFSFIEVLSPCPVRYGPLIKIRHPIDMVKWLRGIMVSKEEAKELTAEELSQKMVVGEFVEKSVPELSEQYLKMRWGENGEN